MFLFKNEKDKMKNIAFDRQEKAREEYLKHCEENPEDVVEITVKVKAKDQAEFVNMLHHMKKLGIELV